MKYLLVLLIMISPSSWAFDHNHSLYDQVLKTYVKMQTHSSTVDYKNLRQNPKNLDDYLKTLSAVNDQEFSQWNSTQKMAFLINAYNGFTLKVIIEHLYPAGPNGPALRSIKDIGSLFTNTWNKEFPFLILFGKKVVLDYIEHQRLRKDFSEPRVHFAINCASIGCPKLMNAAFTASNLESLLEDGANNFLTDQSRNHYDEKDNELILSPIFKWFKEDFTKNGMPLQKFVNRWMSTDPKIQEKMLKADISYSDYDWNLNIAN